MKVKSSYPPSMATSMVPHCDAARIVSSTLAMALLDPRQWLERPALVEMLVNAAHQMPDTGSAGLVAFPAGLPSAQARAAWVSKQHPHIWKCSCLRSGGGVNGVSKVEVGIELLAVGRGVSVVAQRTHRGIADRWTADRHADADGAVSWLRTNRRVDSMAGLVKLAGPSRSDAAGQQQVRYPAGGGCVTAQQRASGVLVHFRPHPRAAPRRPAARLRLLLPATNPT